ncbi:MAG: hypothetical protein LC659_16285, partial [Myxococcales bacterium]|nr:hypothetical protein [Myxococcales bacterium]
TGFALFSVAAIAVSMLFYEDLVGPKTAGVAGYYAGASARARADSAAAATGVGPKIELPDEAAATTTSEQLTVAVTYRKLLEVTHFHLFTVPVFLLIIAHLFMLTGLSSTAKTAWIAAGWLSAFVHLLAPWLIRYGGRAWSFTYPTSGAVMGLALSVMTIYPIIVMWLPRRETAKN